MYYRGNENILRAEKAAILNSRQSKTPCGIDPWLKKTFGAVYDAVTQGYTIITSIGMNTWEFLVWATRFNNGRQIIVLPITDKEDEDQLISELTHDYELDRELTGFMFFKVAKKGHRGKSAWSERDRTVVSLANHIYPVSLRTNGNLEKLILENPAKVTRATLDYNVNYDPAGHRPDCAIDLEKVNPILREESWNYLTHYTRTAYRSWPGESSAAYYHALFCAESSYPRSALDTLRRIVEMKKLWASYYHIRGGYKVVSFTAQPPLEALKLLRWRPRYVRWNFEPYAVAIHKDYAMNMGVRPVIYAPPDDFHKLKDEDKPFYQNPGERGTDWRPEKEWRYHGNFSFEDIPADKIKVLVKSEQDNLACEYPCIPITELG
jgi:hypothetical protein